MAAAVALKTLEIFARDRIVDKVVALIPQFSDGLNQMSEHPLVGEARGLGLVGGIELVADKRTKRAFDPKLGVAAQCVAAAGVPLGDGKMPEFVRELLGLLYRAGYGTVCLSR